MAKKNGQPDYRRKPERVVVKQEGKDMPINVWREGMQIWPGFHGHTYFTKEEALALAQMILDKYGPK